MAITSGSFPLAKVDAAPILTATRKQSVVMALGTQVELGLGGSNVPVFTDTPTASFVGEAAAKPVWDPAVSNKTMQVRKLAIIIPVSAETARANPSGVIESLTGEVGGAFARALDAYVLHGGVAGAEYVDQSAKSVELGTATQATGGVYGDLNAALKLLVDDSRDLTGFAFDNTAEPLVNAAVDLNGRPLFVDAPIGESNPVLRTGRVLGRPAIQAKGLKAADGTVVGYAGDFSRIYWGALGEMTVDFSTDGTYVNGTTVVSAYQNNLVLARFEQEVGYVIADPADFVKLDNATP